ncbi:ankyrin repeat domain-containing protein [Undibacterium sp. Di27W]|uniref:ankyrin repeat domain-containing protein n=1 Tax=Undibacterium sp. Di27W TaxID=3413036 RepID=UPI003BF3949B
MDDRLEKAREIRACILTGDAERSITLLRSNADILTMMTPFGTWLHVAAAAGALSIAKELVNLGLDINARGGTLKGNALNSAASNGHHEVVKYLISRGSELDVTEPERNQLFSAIYAGSLDTVKVLVENGFDISIQYSGASMKAMDALGFAKQRGQTEIASFLNELEVSKNNKV